MHPQAFCLLFPPPSRSTSFQTWLILSSHVRQACVLSLSRSRVQQLTLSLPISLNVPPNPTASNQLVHNAAIREFDAKLLLAHHLARAPQFGTVCTVRPGFTAPDTRVAQVSPPSGPGRALLVLGLALECGGYGVLAE